MARDVVGRAVDAVGVAGFRTDVDCAFREAVEGEGVGLGRAPNRDLAAVEHRNLEQDIEAAFPEWRGLRVAGFSGDAGDVERGYGTCRFRQVEGLGQASQ